MCDGHTLIVTKPPKSKRAELTMFVGCKMLHANGYLGGDIPKGTAYASL